MEGKKQTEKDKGPANEVKVTSTTFMRTYLAYIARLIEEKYEKIIVKAMGNAIPRAMNLGMLVRKRFKGIHQIAELSMIDSEDSRKIGLITITISKSSLDKNHVGYIGPLPDSEVVEYKPYVPGQPRENQDNEEGRATGGRFRRRFGGRNYGGRGFGRGRFRGGYGRGGYQGGYQDRKSGV